MGEEQQKGHGNGGNNSYFPAGFSPENPYFYSPRQNSSINPFDGFLGDQNQILESAFSRLNLSPEFQYQIPPLSASIDDLVAAGQEPGLGYYYTPSETGLGYRGRQWSSNGSQDLSFGGAYENLRVGHHATSSNYGGFSGFSGEGVFGNSTMYNANDSLRLNALLNSGNGYYSFLQGKKSSPRRLNPEFPNLPCSSLRHNNSPSYGGKEFEYLSLQDFRGNIVKLAMDENLSVILQEKLEKPCNEGSIGMVVSEVVDYVADLMTNKIGSDFISRLFGVCSEEQRTRIIMAVTKNSFQFVGICLEPHGAKTMQKILENLVTPEHISFVITAMCQRIVRLANDADAQHLVRHSVVNCSPEYNKHLLNAVAKNCYEIGIDRTGCCVLQYCVEKAHGETRDHLIDEIIKNALHLAEDPYGNYVVQHLMSQKIPGVVAKLLEQLQYHFVALSCNKYGSNVVEKFLSESGKENANLIIIELVKSPNAAMLLFDPFGNFVIQTALSVAEGYVSQRLHNLISENEPRMRSHAFGKRILSCFIEKKKPSVVNTCTSRKCQ